MLSVSLTDRCRKIFTSKGFIFFVFIILCLVMGFFPPDIDYQDFISYWVQYIDDCGLFNVYLYHMNQPLHFVNYPPLYLYYLYFIHKPVIWAMSHQYLFLTLFLLKSGTLIFHCLCSYWLYHKVDKFYGLLWYCCPVWLVISGLTIHIDEVFCFLLILELMAIKRNKFMQVYVIFAVICLLKLQGAYLLPIVVWYSFVNRKQIKRVIYGWSCFVGVSFCGWLPFMIGSKSVLFPVSLYWNGFHSNYTNMFVPCSFLNLFAYLLSVFDKDGFEIFVNVFLLRISLLLLLICIVYFFVLAKKLPLELAYLGYFYSVFYVCCSQDLRYFSYSIMLCAFIAYVYGYQQFRHIFLQMLFVFVSSSVSMIFVLQFVKTYFDERVALLTSLLLFIIIYGIAYMTYVEFTKIIWGNDYQRKLFGS